MIQIILQLAKSRRQKILIQDLLDKTKEERNYVMRRMDVFISKKELVEAKIRSRAVELESQTRIMTELYAEMNLIGKTLMQLVNIDFCAEVLDGT